VNVILFPDITKSDKYLVKNIGRFSA